MALCQGAALHFIDQKTGIKDFDIWYFYVENPKVRYPYRARKRVDSRLGKFRTHPDDVHRGYEGRRVDLMGRTIEISIVKRNRRNPKDIVVEYLERRRTETSKELARKGVVGLWPEQILGEVIWSDSRF